MKKNTIAKKIDLIFISVTLYILLFIFFFYIYKDAVYCMILSVLSLFVLHLFFFGISKKRREKQKLKSTDQKHCDNIFFSLPYIIQKKQEEFFADLFKKAGFSTDFCNGILTVTKGEIKRNLKICFSQNVNVFIVYSSEHERQESECDGFIIICENYKDDAKAVINNINNDKNLILTKNQLYKTMKKYDFYPQVLYAEKQNKKVFKELFAYAFKRERFKSYFILAVIMFLFSFISPFKNYYLIFSAVLFMFCLFSLLTNRQKNN